jgi:hypothetical protein
MPYTPVRPRFLDASARPVSRYEARLLEPTSGTASGDVLSLTYTPAKSGEHLRAGAGGGPAARGGVEVALNGGSYANPASGAIALSGAGVAVAVAVRPYAAAFVGDDSELTTVVVVATRGGDADWLA